LPHKKTVKIVWKEPNAKYLEEKIPCMDAQKRNLASSGPNCINKIIIYNYRNSSSKLRSSQLVFSTMKKFHVWLFWAAILCICTILIPYLQLYLFHTYIKAFKLNTVLIYACILYCVCSKQKWSEKISHFFSPLKPNWHYHLQWGKISWYCPFSTKREILTRKSHRVSNISLNTIIPFQ